MVARPKVKPKKSSWFEQLSKRPSSPVLDLVRVHLLARSVEDNGRDSTVFHPSEIVSDTWCPRRDTFRILGHPEGAATPIPMHLMSIFEHGHMVHRKWQRWLADQGSLEGLWGCAAGHHVYGVASDIWDDPRERECPHCSLPSEYEEVPARLPGLRLGGHADGVVDGRLLEIKTLGPGTWWALDSKQALASQVERADGGSAMVDWDQVWFRFNAPFIKHIQQASLYVYMLRESGAYPEMDEMSFIYEYKPNQQVKEFVVGFSEEMIKPLLGGLMEASKAVSDGHPARRPEWAALDSSVCTKCPFFTECWSEK